MIQLYGEHVSLVRDYDRLVGLEDMLSKEGNSVAKEDLISNAVSSLKSMTGLQACRGVFPPSFSTTIRTIWIR